MGNECQHSRMPMAIQCNLHIQVGAQSPPTHSSLQIRMVDHTAISININMVKAAPLANTRIINILPTPRTCIPPRSVVLPEEITAWAPPYHHRTMEQAHCQVLAHMKRNHPPFLTHTYHQQIRLRQREVLTHTLTISSNTHSTTNNSSSTSIPSIPTSLRKTTPPPSLIVFER